MLLGQPIVQRRWQQQSLVQIVGTKALSHGRILSRNTRWKTCYVWYPCSSRIYFRQTPRCEVFYLRRIHRVARVRRRRFYDLGSTARPDSLSLQVKMDFILTPSGLVSILCFTLRSKSGLCSQRFPLEVLHEAPQLMTDGTFVSGGLRCADCYCQFSSNHGHGSLGQRINRVDSGRNRGPCSWPVRVG